MLGIGKYAQRWFYIEYSIYTHKLVLQIKGYQLFINCMSDATNNKSFGLVLRASNEVCKRIYYIIDDIFVFFYQWLYDIVYGVLLPYPG